MHKVTVLDKKDAIHCPIRNVIDRIGDKWSLIVLVILSEQPTRFNELKRTVGDISQKVLTQVLKNLEQDGYINRTEYHENQLKVVYELTEMGLSILDPIEELIHWAEQNHSKILKNREKYSS